MSSEDRLQVCVVLLCCQGFPTSRLEMEAVADRFDTDGDGYIDYREFVAALRWPARVSSARHHLILLLVIVASGQSNLT